MPTTPYNKTSLPAEVDRSDFANLPTADVQTHYNKILRPLKELWACINGADAGNDSDGVALQSYLNNGLTDRLEDIESGEMSLSGNKSLPSVAQLGFVSESLVIASGSITVTKPLVLLGTESAAATDELDTIVAHTKNDFIIIRPDDDAEDVIVKHNTGNILLRNSQDCRLESTQDTITLYYDLTKAKWLEISRSNDPKLNTNQGTEVKKNPSYVDSASFTVYDGTAKIDSTGKHLIKLTADVTVSLASSGAAGLDTGSEAATTHYYAYLIGDTTGSNSPSVLVSVTNEADTGTITLPSGYDIKAQLPFAVTNDGSSNIIPFFVIGKLGLNALISYDVTMDTTNASPTNVLYVTTSSTSFTDVDLSDFVPDISLMASVHFCFFNTANQVGYIRQNGSGHNGLEIGNKTAMNFAQAIVPMLTDSSQLIEYKSGTTGQDTTINVHGYYVTEVY